MLIALVCAPSASAAQKCEEPGAKASPAAAGMDAAKLSDALDEGPQNLSLSVRVFRHGCLVAADPLEATNRDTKFETGPWPNR